MAKNVHNNKAKTGLLYRMFLAHPHSVNESYFAHLRFAFWVAGRLLLAGGAAIIHALLPSLCQKTASKIIIELHDLVSPRN